MQIKPIATIHTDFPEKFGIPRQSGRASTLTGVVSFFPKYRNPEAVKGLSEFNYIWLLWRFEIPETDEFKACVRPPRLGGNTKVGVFATRSPFRPNPIGLSCVKLDKIEFTEAGPLLYVSGIDMKDGTEIIDIKPYIPYTDAKPDALGSFAEEVKDYALKVDFPEELFLLFPIEKREGILAVLADDPRPSYQNDNSRIYGISYAGFNVKFTVSDDTLTVTEVIPLA